jgi:hypothetical protein
MVGLSRGSGKADPTGKGPLLEPKLSHLKPLSPVARGERGRRMGLSRGSFILDFQAHGCPMPPAIRRDNMRAKPLLGQRCTPSRVRAAQWTWSWIYIDDSRHAWRMVLECWREPHPLRKASRTVGRCRWRFCNPPPLRRRCDGCWLCHRCRRRRCDKRLCFRRRGGVWLGGCGWPLGSNRLRFFFMLKATSYRMSSTQPRHRAMRCGTQDRGMPAQTNRHDEHLKCRRTETC